MKILIAHSNFKYRNRRNETIHFQVQANYEVTLEAEIELLCYKEFSGIALYNIENENIENPINFNARITNILSIHQSDFAWEENLKYNCHYYSFFQRTDYWLNDIDRFLDVNESNYNRINYTDGDDILEDDIILFKNNQNEIIHSCRYDGNEFIHKCGARGVHKFENLEDWKTCKECKYDATNNYEICREIVIQENTVCAENN